MKRVKRILVVLLALLLALPAIAQGEDDTQTAVVFDTETEIETGVGLDAADIYAYAAGGDEAPEELDEFIIGEPGDELPDEAPFGQPEAAEDGLVRVCFIALDASRG